MGRKLIHKGPVVDLGSETVTLPNGTSLSLDIVRHPGGAAVVALNSNEEICLLHQFRHAAGGWLWELPAGKIDPNEQAGTTASRELAEEAGVKSKQLTSLGKILTTPGFCDEAVFLFLATDLSQCALQQEEHEVIDIHWIKFHKAIEMIHTGEIVDAKTIAGLFYATRYLSHKDTIA
ncbi:MAG: NUDIX hydrolase [Gammaproteobacteria bacterium]